MGNLSSNKKLNFLITLCFYGVCAGLFYLAVKFLLPWLLPFIIAFIISAALQKPIRFLSQKTIIKAPKTWSVILVAITYLFLFFIIFIIGQEIIQQILSLLQRLPDFIQTTFPNLAERLEKFLVSTADSLPFDIQLNTESLIQALEGSDIPKKLTDVVINTTTSLGSFIASSFPMFLISFIITIVATFFICADYSLVIKFIKAQIPQKWQNQAVQSKKFFTQTLYKMIKSYSIIMFITFIELMIFFMLARVDYAIAVAAIVCIIDILPVLGVGTVLIPWFIIAAILGDWSTALWMLGAYLIITIVRNIIEPKIVGKSIGLHPILTLINMYVGLKLFGVIGMFILPMALIFLKMLQKNGYIHLWNDLDDSDRQKMRKRILPLTPVFKKMKKKNKKTDQ